MDSIQFLFYLIFPFLLFFVGLLGVIISKNIVRILLSLLISLSAVCINFILAEKFVNYTSDVIFKTSTCVFIMLILQFLIIAFVVYRICLTKNTFDIEKIEKRKRVD